MATPEEESAAIEDSIEAWKRKLTIDDPEKITMGSGNCPLCHIFILANETCIGCPVYKATHRMLCGGTPRLKASECLNNWRLDPDNAALRCKFLIAAQEMINFLKSLRKEPQS